MLQVKFFQCNDFRFGDIETILNTFLQEHHDKIRIVDIKYRSETTNSANNQWTKWTAMIIFETEAPLQIKNNF